MSLRDQPYLPLYVQDFLTDEKLAECSAQSTGVYIRLMCLMHKSDVYGKILLKQKFKQKGKQELNFALQIAKHFPYDLLVVESAIVELVAEKVLIIEGDYLVQKRMVKDASISEKRSVSGSKGGKNTQDKNKDFAKAKNKANAEYENEDEDVIKSKEEKKEKNTPQFPTTDHIIELSDIEIGVCQQLMKYSSQKVDLTTDDVKTQFKSFKLTNLDGNHFYETQSDIIKHFKNWLKLQKFDNGKLQQQRVTGARHNPKTAGQEQLLAKLHGRFEDYANGAVID